MRRREYLNRLEALLAALPEQERQDAMNYYEDYFDAAGLDKEQQTMEELGSPEQVAQKILEGAGLNAAVALPAAGNPDRRLFFGVIFGVVVLALLLLVVALGAGLVTGQSSGKSITPPAAGSLPAEPSGTAEGPLPTASSEPAASEEGNGLYPMQGQKNTLSMEVQEGTLIVEQDPSLTQMEVRTEDLQPGRFMVEQKTDGYAIRYTGSNHEEGKNPRIEVTLPADAGLETLDIQMAVGRVTLGDLQAEDISVEVQTGTLKAGVLTASEVTVDNLLGQVDIDRIAGAEDVELSCEVGTLQAELEGGASQYAVDSTCNTGALQIDGQPVPVGSYQKNGDQPRKIQVEIGTGKGEITFQS